MSKHVNGEDIVIRAEDSLKDFDKRLTDSGFITTFAPAVVDFIIWTADKPVLAERKTTNDFVRSIQDSSLFEQARAMTEVSPNAFILIEDYCWRDFFRYTFKEGGTRVTLSPNSIIGAMDAVSRKMNVKVISTLSKKGTLYWLTKVLEETKGIRKQHESALRPSASRKLSIEEQAEYLLQGLPGIGPVTSREIRKSYMCFDDFYDSFWCAKEPPPKGISLKLFEKWRNIITTNWKINGDKK